MLVLPLFQFSNEKKEKINPLTFLTLSFLSVKLGDVAGVGNSDIFRTRKAFQEIQCDSRMQEDHGTTTRIGKPGIKSI